MSDTSVSLTADEALVKLRNQLNTEMTNFDRWISNNPNAALSSNDEYRVRRQTIKLLRLKINEVQEMKNVYHNTLRTIKET